MTKIRFQTARTSGKGITENAMLKTLEAILEFFKSDDSKRLMTITINEHDDPIDCNNIKNTMFTESETESRFVITKED